MDRFSAGHNFECSHHASRFFSWLAAALIFFLYAPTTLSEDSKAPCISLNNIEQEKFADGLLEAGNTFYLSGDLQSANKAWIDARSCSPEVPAWPKAVYNLGILEMNRANYPKAIGYFDEVLRSHPNDREPGEDIMQVYRNYSNRSVLRTAECYEKMRYYRAALHYTWLAKTRYPYRSWCGTCLQSANLAVWKRIIYLTFRAYQIPVLGILVLAGIYFFWKNSRAARVHRV